MRSHILFLWVFLISILDLSGQELIPLSQWRVHPAYNQAISITASETRIYVATRAALFSFDPGDNQIRTLTRLDGLSDAGISTIFWHSNSNTLLIGYENGNLDFLADGRIRNLPLVKNAAILGSKRFNQFTAHGDMVFAATGIGLLLIDPFRLEIRETYRDIGPGGVPLNAYQAAIAEDTVFLATSLGIQAAGLTGTNLLDFNQWLHFDAGQGLPEEPATLITNTDQGILAWIGGEGLFSYQFGNMWEPLTILQDVPLKSIRRMGSSLLITTDSMVLEVDADFNISELSPSFVQEPKDAIFWNNQIWIADQRAGLVRSVGGNWNTIKPQGPFSDETSSLFFYQNDLYQLPSGYDAGFNPTNNDLGFNVFSGGFWTNFSSTSIQGTEEIPEFSDIVDGTYVPALNALYLASFGMGLINLETGEIINENTPGSPLVNEDPEGNRVLISALEATSEGLYVLNFGADTPLHRFKGPGQWDSFNLSLIAARQTVEMIATASGILFLRPHPGLNSGFFGFAPDQGIERAVTVAPSSGNLPDNRVYSLHLDRNGALWAGTHSGVIIFSNPSSIIEDQNFSGFLPIFDGRPLLNDERVFSIASDGGNRKWIGTQNGAWLFAPNGEALIYHFTTQNSPLPSNRIDAIAINDKTGEVFFATPNGLASFRSDATASQPSHSNVKIFPNPVRSDFMGMVGVEGLVNRAQVKITDISGRLVWEGRSQGGTFSWDVRDLRGRRVGTGVYLVFSSDDTGNDTFVGKIAVIK